MKQRNVPLDVSSYLNIDELRTDIAEYLEDPDAFRRNFERKAKKRSEEREFMELNNLMPVAPARELKAPKKASKVGIEAETDVLEELLASFSQWLEKFLASDATRNTSVISSWNH